MGFILDNTVPGKTDKRREEQGWQSQTKYYRNHKNSHLFDNTNLGHTRLYRVAQK